MSKEQPSKAVIEEAVARVLAFGDEKMPPEQTVRLVRDLAAGVMVLSWQCPECKFYHSKPVCTCGPKPPP